MGTRLNVQFTERQKRALEAMAEDLGTTQAEVLKKALSLLQVTLRERRQDGHIAVVKDGKIVKEIIGISE